MGLAGDSAAQRMLLKMNHRALHHRLAWFAMLAWPALLTGQSPTRADSGPRVPCADQIYPAYPDVDHAPIVTIWNRSELGRDWSPPGCTGWSVRGFSMLVATAAQFRDTSGVEGLLTHIGAISQLAGMRYWSTTRKRWDKLIVSANALSGPAAANKNEPPRQDFSLNEIAQGQILYFDQWDNLSGRAIYRLRVMSASADRLVFETENVTAIRYLRVTIFPPGEMQSIYFLHQASPGIWSYYNITRMGKNANGLLMGHDASSINRAVAFFRYWAGIPTDQEPPAAR
jgi:hypothetical protein